MSKSQIELKLVIKDKENGKQTSGHLVIKPVIDIGIEHIEAEIQFEARGRIQSKRDFITSIILQRELIFFKKNEIYTIPFVINFEESIASYKGKNINFTYNCEVKLTINKDFKKLNPSIFKKIRSFVNSEKTLKISESFKVYEKNGNYQVKERTSIFSLQMNWAVSILFAIVWGGIYAYYVPVYNPPYIFGGVILIGTGIFLIQQYLGKTLGEMSMEPERDQASFNCSIHKNRDANFRKLTIYYTIVEEVVDQRGTSATTYDHTIYTSEKLTIADFNSNPSVNFKYPEYLGLESTKFGDASIHWKMHLEGKSFYGMTLKYNSVFEVKIDY